MADFTPRTFLGDDVINTLLEQGASEEEIADYAQQQYALQKNPKYNPKNISDFDTFTGRLQRGFGAGITSAPLWINRLVDGVYNSGRFTKEFYANALKQGRLKPTKEEAAEIYRKSGIAPGTHPFSIENASDASKGLYDYQQAHRAEEALWKQTTGKMPWAATGAEFAGSMVDPLNVVGGGSVGILKRVGLNFLGGAISGGAYSLSMDDKGIDVLKNSAVSGVGGAAFGELFFGAFYGAYKLKVNSLKKQLESAAPEQKEEILGKIAKLSANIGYSPEQQDALLGRILNAKTPEERQKILQDISENDPLFTNMENIDTKTAVNTFMEGYDTRSTLAVLNEIESGVEKSSVLDDETYAALKEYTLSVETIKTLRTLGDELAQTRATIVTAEENSINAYTKDVELVQQYMNKFPKFSMEQINQLVSVNNKPTPEMIRLSQWINDGIEVNPRATGVKIIPMLENEIQNGMRTPDQLFERLRELGFNDESAGVFTQSYGNKDINIAKDYIYKKIVEKGADDAAAKMDLGPLNKQSKTAPEAKKTQQKEKVKAEETTPKADEPVVAKTETTQEAETPLVETETTLKKKEVEYEYLPMESFTFEKKIGERVKTTAKDFEDIDFAVRKDESGYWQAEDIATGFRITNNFKTKKSTLEELKTILEKFGRKKYDETVKKILDNYAIIKAGGNPNEVTFTGVDGKTINGRRATIITDKSNKFDFARVKEGDEIVIYDPKSGLEAGRGAVDSSAEERAKRALQNIDRATYDKYASIIEQRKQELNSAEPNPETKSWIDELYPADKPEAKTEDFLSKLEDMAIKAEKDPVKKSELKNQIERERIEKEIKIAEERLEEANKDINYKESDIEGNKYRIEHLPKKESDKLKKLKTALNENEKKLSAYKENVKNAQAELDSARAKLKEFEDTRVNEKGETITEFEELC
ncbi:MAG: hypothetical protein LBS26_07145 [Campylobacteraceae bacterium]|jgi:hypothetical protein|nr:hypothetical protein [Campylobacteraceae bacterium]